MQEIRGTSRDIGELYNIIFESLFGNVCLINMFFNLFQKEGDPSMHDNVVLLLQDMLEVVTRDMMVNEIRSVNLA